MTNSQLNFYYTNEINDQSQNLQHHCLRVIQSIHDRLYNVLWYCMNEFSIKFESNITNEYRRFNFAQLSSRNITSKDLYDWSASIDLVEQYQFYLNQLSQSINDTFLAKQIFFNCTWPTFGFKCQYAFYYLFSANQSSSLFSIVYIFYSSFPYEPNELTCYQHLKCNRGPFPSCLDWTEICNGRIDCFDDGIDEKDCWKLEINQCEEHEHRCLNGQCVVPIILQGTRRMNCLDSWDKYTSSKRNVACSGRTIPQSSCEDARCEDEPYSSSCFTRRHFLLKKILYFDIDPSISSTCSSTFKQIYNPIEPETPSKVNESMNMIDINCPSMMIYPNRSPLIDFVFVYSNNLSFDSLLRNPYICYANNYYNEYFSNLPKISFQNLTCINSNFFLNSSAESFFRRQFPSLITIEYLYKTLEKYHHPRNSTSILCRQSIGVYQCLNSSKYISIYRRFDHIVDCPYADDEDLNLIDQSMPTEQIARNYFHCQLSNKYIPQHLIKDSKCDCGFNENNLCEDENLDSHYTKNNVLFQTICDRIIDLFATVDNQTDETDCEQWQCNNIYTRCDDIWNCRDGSDEFGCDLSYSLNCSSSQELLCVSIKTNQLICLPFHRINDGKVDCLGGMDELTACRRNYRGEPQYQFYCQQNHSDLCLNLSSLCDGIEQCADKSDEQFCRRNHSFCSKGIAWNKSDIERLLCDYHRIRYRYVSNDFQIDRPTNPIYPLPSPVQAKVVSNQQQLNNKPNCHRGIDLRVSQERTCLCPPMYYGSRCQYQNQRISLTIQFRSFSDSWKTVFEIVILLIDDSSPSVIHSYERFSYLPIHECLTIFNLYLVYANRSKDPMKNYFIRIDFYEKVSLTYRGSSLYSVDFVFLPVHRLTYIVDIPSTNNQNRTCFNRKCVHGQCIRYNNHPSNRSFCHCDDGWSGDDCTIQQNCTCSSNSRCIGISAANHSICACKNNIFGSRCLMNHSAWKINEDLMCQNNGQCVYLFYDGYYNRRECLCLCPKGFSGVRCERNDTKLTLSFEKEMIVSPIVFIHFIGKYLNRSVRRSTRFGTFNSNDNSVVVFWSESYLLLFIELSGKKYYLVDIQNDANQSLIINRTVSSSDRCRNLSEFFDEDLLKSNILRRIKLYHLPCENVSLNLSCFHDEMHICFCYLFEGKRLSNCFQFDHEMTFNCFGQSECENEGQCFQDDRECPKRSICLCQSCYYGTRCQFSTSGFGLSLDAILGYHIEPDLSLSAQSTIIHISLLLTIVFVLFGLFDGCLSLATFQNKVVCDVGCGIYLLCSSLTTIVISILLVLKYSILLSSQMKMISNRFFLEIQCYSLDFLVRLFLHFDQWLTACVAVERTFTVIKQTRFNKKTSRQTAKYVIILILIVLLTSSIQDPFHRRLIDERNEENDEIKRTWCIVNYSSKWIQKWNSYVQIFHFLIPFAINFLSALVLITMKSRQRLRIEKTRSYFEIVHQQYREHKHLLIAPIILVLLALPRLILTFISECMNSSNDAWLYMILYFISFIPSMLTFVVFISPSKFYKKEFQRTLNQYRTRIRQRFAF